MIKRKYLIGAHILEKAIRKYLPFCTDGDTFDCKKTFDFGTVTAKCAGGKATLWVLFPDKRIATFNLVKVGASLFWSHKATPDVIRSTAQLLNESSCWWQGVQWIESQKDKEAVK